ncbi:MAG: CDP-alcohol phosphatidyltransferase family protein [Acidobacteria bacterium]|nr:CDP-alcohol phosphatidyltransferase family protein [Acidobacteriota bacterium]
MILAVIRANNFRNETRLSGVPLRRALVLSLAKAGVTDIVWEGVERREVAPTFKGAGPSLPRFHFGSRPSAPRERVLIVEESDTFFEPAVFRLLLDWPVEAAIEATWDGKPAGLWIQFPSKFSPEISVELPDSQVFSTTDRLGRRRASAALFRTVALKPTDGIYARFNKKVTARPLIAFFLRTPFSPNAVTLIGFCFALAGAFAFSRGGYGPMLAGALLGYVSALFDHADGVVARLKFQQSPLGCWLETTSDFLSYVVTFGGMSVGLFRETGNSLWLWLGGTMLAGIILSLLSEAVHRRLMTSGKNPEQYIQRLHATLEQNRKNWLARFGRKCYFVARRAFLPYAVLALVLLGQAWLLVWVVAVGANIFWLVSTYYIFSFPRSNALAPAGGQ